MAFQDIENGFGKWLMYNIIMSGNTQTSFSDKYNISRKTLYNHIHKQTMPSFQTVKRYCEIFGCFEDRFDVYDAILDEWNNE